MVIFFCYFIVPICYFKFYFSPLLPPNRSPGFSVQIRYAGGVVIDNESSSTYPNGGILGINNNFDMTPELHRLLTANRAAVEARLPVILAEQQHYRKTLLEKRRKEINDLAWSFWFVVYNNDNLSRSDLRHYFLEHEAHDDVKAVPEEHALGIDLLYVRLAAFDTEPTALWFVFWDEYWELNCELRKIADRPEIFNPSFLSALCYHPCPLSVLMAFLKEKKVKRYVSQEKLKRLYSLMDELAANSAKVAAVRSSAQVAVSKHQSGKAKKSDRAFTDDSSSVASAAGSALSKASSWVSGFFGSESESDASSDESSVATSRSSVSDDSSATDDSSAETSEQSSS